MQELRDDTRVESGCTWPSIHLSVMTLGTDCIHFCLSAFTLKELRVWCVVSVVGVIDSARPHKSCDASACHLCVGRLHLMGRRHKSCDASACHTHPTVTLGPVIHSRASRADAARQTISSMCEQMFLLARLLAAGRRMLGC